ncbi:MAG: TIM44-like domain-containing protein, partial [Alphaproteobacteria bacterium]|nr:TIM44-like domain-containing protein [Alphaproteobacteria bacterium]
NAEGDPSASVRITDIWTFARDVNSSDPNWILVATRSPN